MKPASISVTNKSRPKSIDFLLDLPAKSFSRPGTRRVLQNYFIALKALNNFLGGRSPENHGRIFSFFPVTA